MPKRGRPRITPATPAKQAAQRREVAQASAGATANQPRRTPQNPFEASAEDDGTWKVDKIAGLRFVKGQREYLVAWTGFTEKDWTWEPMSNLTGCAREIREYETEREAQDKVEKEKLLERRAAAKKKSADEEMTARKAEAERQQALLEADVPGEHEAKFYALPNHRQKTIPMWDCFDLTVEEPSCKLLNTLGQVCGAKPSMSAGTSNFWSHLWTHHREKWYELKHADGKLNAVGEAELKNLAKMLTQNSGSHSKGGSSLKNKLQGAAKDTLDRLTAEWIVDEDQAFNAASTPGFKRMMSGATNEQYDGCSDKMVKRYVTAMAIEGRAEVARFHQELLERSVKPTASGDLWSKNKMALFGLVSHGIKRTRSVLQEDGAVQIAWTMQEKLCGSVPCRKDRHTGEFICEISDAAWKNSGISNPVEQIFARVSDNGANMMKGWQNGFQTPCVDHTLELSVHKFTAHPAIEATLSKGRGLVGYFNSSVVGYSEANVGLHACQHVARVPENTLTQDVKTRWRSTHDMANSLRINQEALLFYDVRNSAAAEGFKNNRYSLEDWTINNQAVAVLAPLAKVSKYLEGKTYPTLNLVLPSIYGCIALLNPESPVKVPWSGVLIPPSEMREEVQEARQQLYDDMVLRWKTNLSEELLRFYCTATMLDPRHKNLAFPSISAHVRSSARVWFISEFDSLWRKDPAAEEPDQAKRHNSSRRSKHAQHEGASFLDFLDGMAHLEGAAGEQHSSSDEETALEQYSKSEAERYLEEPQASKTTDLLKWWASRERDYPQLAKMAQQYLGCPACSASAERLFSLAGRAYNDLRQAMDDKTLEELMWARINRESRLGAKVAIQLEEEEDQAPVAVAEPPQAEKA